MSALDTHLQQAWSEHAERPEDVARGLSAALAWVDNDDGAMRLAALAHHVWGEHLARWSDGLDFLQALAARRSHGATAEASIARCQASLRLCASLADERSALSPSDACRVSAMAAANLAVVESARAAELLEQAARDSAALPNDDPAVRALAANANGIAANWEEHASRTSAERSLMLRAAEFARRDWERAGSWREVERAEYRLAMSWLAAGDAPRARQHAQACEAIVREHGAEPLELFFAAEALGLSAKVLGDNAAYAAALTTAQEAFLALSADDQAWCRPTLDKLASR